MDELRIETLPDLRQPTFIAAFRGWNDAAESATLAVRHLIETWGAQPFASIDPESFYDFTVARPLIRITEEGQRDLHWPANTFYYHRLDEREHDVVLLLGTEPHLRWRTFVRCIEELYRRLQGARLLTLGALVAVTVHTRPAPITGFATEPSIQERLAGLAITRSRYEGPTGIVGVLHDAWRRADWPAASLWVAVPGYLGNTMNPKGALALLEAVDKVFGFVPDLSKLQEASRLFEQQVNDAIAGNLEMRALVQELERRIDAGISEAATPDVSPKEKDGGELPSASELIGELEEFLRRQKRGSE